MKFVIYRDKKGEWRWHLKARNGRIVAESGEGYKSKAHCRKMVKKIEMGAFSAEIVEKL